LDLLNRIDIRDMPPNQRIEHTHEALSKIRVAEGALMIWGNFQTGQLGNHKYSGFHALNFTYRHPKNVSREYYDEIHESMAQRKLIYSESNDLVEKSVVANHIAQVALFIIGLTLITQGKFEEAEQILGPLDVSLEPFRQSNRISPLSRFCTLVRKNRLRSVFGLGSRQYNELIWKRGIYHATTAELARWESKLAEAILLDNQDGGLYHQLAVVKFLGGDIDEALRAAKRSKKLSPRADAVPDFSLGFLYLYKGDIRKGLKHYRVALAKKTHDQQQAIFEIVEFLRQILERHSNKIQFHYALGMLNEERLDPAIARQEYELFLKGEQAHPELLPFFEEVKQRLQNFPVNETASV